MSKPNKEDTMDLTFFWETEYQKISRERIERRQKLLLTVGVLLLLGLIVLAF
jgi:hypothetical protein